MKLPALACTLGLATVLSPARADLVVTPDGVAVHDTVSGTYWLRDMTAFANMSYSDQIAAIGKYGDGNWQMAELEHIESLDPNSDDSIHDTFLPAAQSSVDGDNVDIYFGRVDFEFGPGIHMIGHMSWNTTDDEVFSTLMYLGNGGSDDGPGEDGQGGFPAWVVHVGPYDPDGGDTCPADLDDDGEVAVLDLVELILQWGSDGSADFNDDGIVDVLDLIELIGLWGPCPA
jgi:hypothetical protein